MVSPMRSSAWVMPFGLLVVAIVVVPLQILDEQGLPRYRQLHGELQQIRERNDALRRETEQLRREVERLRSDPSAIEAVARDELGMVREGEIVFQFPSQEVAPSDPSL